MVGYFFIAVKRLAFGHLDWTQGKDKKPLLKSFSIHTQPDLFGPAWGIGFQARGPTSTTTWVGTTCRRCTSEKNATIRPIASGTAICDILKTEETKMSQHHVDRESWHYRIYEWWYNHKYPGRYSCRLKTSTNLCPYVRAILFWAPLRFIFWAKVYEWDYLYNSEGGKPVYDKYIPLNVLTIPFLLYTVPKLAGYASWKFKYALWQVEIALGIALTVIGVVAGLLYVITCLRDWIRAKRALRPKKEKTPSVFGPLVRDYLRAAHDGICYEIIFDKPPKKEKCPIEGCHCDKSPYDYSGHQ